MVVAGPPRCPRTRRSACQSVVAAIHAAVRVSGRHCVRRGRRRVRRTDPAARLDRRPDPAGLPTSPRAWLGPQRRDLVRRRTRGRPVRPRDRGAVRSRVQISSPHRRLEGGGRRSGYRPGRRPSSIDRCAMANGSSGDARRHRNPAGSVPRATPHRAPEPRAPDVQRHISHNQASVDLNPTVPVPMECR